MYAAMGVVLAAGLYVSVRTLQPVVRFFRAAYEAQQTVTYVPLDALMSEPSSEPNNEQQIQRRLMEMARHEAYFRLFDAWTKNDLKPAQH